MQKSISALLYMIIAIVMYAGDSALAMRISTKSHVELPISRLQLRQDDSSGQSMISTSDESDNSTPNENVVSVEYGETSVDPESGLDPDSEVFDPTAQLEWVYNYQVGSTVEGEEFCSNYTEILHYNDLDEELHHVPVRNSDNVDEAIDYYQNLLESLNHQQLSIFDNQVSVSFVGNAFDDQVTLTNLTEEVCNLSENYRDIHEQFHIEEPIQVDSFGCDYYTGDDDSISEGPYCLVYVTINGVYEITGATIYLNSLVIDSRDYEDGVKRVFYSGFLRLNEYYGFTDDQIELIDQNIPITIRTYNSVTRNSYSSDAPEFNMTAYPDLYQLDVGLVLMNLYQNQNIALDPPRGVGNLNYLPATLLEMTTRSAVTTRVRISTAISEFYFMAGNLAMTESVGEIDFYSETQYSVIFDGSTRVGDLNTTSSMEKESYEEGYTILMTGTANEYMDYEIFEQTLGVSLTTEPIELLPNYEFQEIMLDRVNINEEYLHFYTPTVRLYFEPFLLYRMQGFHGKI